MRFRLLARICSQRRGAFETFGLAFLDTNMDSLRLRSYLAHTTTARVDTTSSVSIAIAVQIARNPVGRREMHSCDMLVTLLDTCVTLDTSAVESLESSSWRDRSSQHSSPPSLGLLTSSSAYLPKVSRCRVLSLRLMLKVGRPKAIFATSSDLRRRLERTLFTCSPKVRLRCLYPTGQTRSLRTARESDYTRD